MAVLGSNEPPAITEHDYTINHRQWLINAKNKNDYIPRGDQIMGLAKLLQFYQCFSAMLGKYTEPFALLALRLVGAKVFLDSGMSKWNGFLNFNTEKYDLFLYEFFCPDPIRPGALLLCEPSTLEYTEGSMVVAIIESLAVTAGVVEVVLPILLILGLFTRFAAIGLLGMTLFIQLAVFPTMSHWWNPAVWWAVVMFALMASGPGRLSLDQFFGLDRKN